MTEKEPEHKLQSKQRGAGKKAKSVQLGRQPASYTYGPDFPAGWLHGKGGVLTIDCQRIILP